MMSMGKNESHDAHDSALPAVVDHSSSEAPGGSGVGDRYPPLLFESFSKEWSGIANQDHFDGFRLEIGKQVTKQMQCNQSVFLGTRMRDCGYLFSFGPTYQSADGRRVLVARYNLDGNVNGRYIQKLFGNACELKVNVNSNLGDKSRNFFETAIDTYLKAGTISAKVAYQGSMILNLAHTRDITDRLSLGAELTFVASNFVSIGSLGGRYVYGPNIFSATLGRQPDFRKGPAFSVHQMKTQYVRRVSDRLSIGTELDINTDKESSMKLGSEYTFRHAKVSASVDTAGRIGCFVNDFTGFGLSATIDYPKGDYQFGFMMHVVPQPDASAQGQTQAGGSAGLTH